MKNFLVIIAALTIFSLTIGCGGQSGPVNVSSDQPVIQKSAADTSNRTVWGFWDCFIDTATGSVQVKPLRGANFTVNTNNLLEASPGNLLIGDIELTDYFTLGRIDCTVTLRHPFIGLDNYHGFDVWGVFMHNGSKSLAYDGLLVPDYDSDTDGLLLNPDGFTRWFNYSEFNGGAIPLLEYYEGKLSDLPNPSAVVNAFKIFADGLDEEDDFYTWISETENSSDRGIFRAGNVNSRRYELQFPMVDDFPVLTFQYAVVATWEEGDPELTGLPSIWDPEDFPESANCDEAFFINISTAGSDLFYEDPSTLGGTFNAEIEVFDWQGGWVGNHGVLNEVERIILEGNFLPGGYQELTHPDLDLIAFPGTENSSVFQVEIGSCTPTTSGINDFFVIVESAGENGADYFQEFPTEFPENAHRAAYMRGLVDVAGESPGNLAVTAIDPDTVPFWSFVDDAEVTGFGFVNGCTVELRKDADSVVAAEVIFQSSTSLLVDFDLTGADSGAWDVVVINPGDLEGILPAGFTIDVWSEEFLVEEDGNRLPQMAETSDGVMALAIGASDNSMKYHYWDDTWSDQYLLDTRSSHSQLSLTSDPVNDYVYLFVAPGGPSGHYMLYRYNGGTAEWDEKISNFVGVGKGVFFADLSGTYNTVHHTISAYGHIVQCQANSWTASWTLPPHWFNDGRNDKTCTRGNFWDINTAGTSYIIYERDSWLDPYSPGVGRYIRLAMIPDGDWVNTYIGIESNFTQADALDSPAVTVDSNDDVHAAYRKFDSSTSAWSMVYEGSTDNGYSWPVNSVIWSGAEEPMDDYTYLAVDSNDVLHAMYLVDGYFEYKESSDGNTWSDSEIANESADSLPVGEGDFMPEMVISSDDIMHVAWIRGNAASGYGDIYHRMRDMD